ncbi:MAG: HNH endonuclease [Anaerolineae bacterium]|jgi:putative restriction endonuclease
MGRLYIGVTDNDWFHFLAARRPDEVNFWLPGDQRRFRTLETGELFLFKLHSPDDYIVGGGLFVSHTLLPLSMAWEVFGTSNGVPDLATLSSKIRHYRASRGAIGRDPTIGCIVLAEPFFLEPAAWLPMPAGWHRNIVQGKSYEIDSPEGRRLLDSVLPLMGHRIGSPAVGEVAPRVIAEEGPRYGPETPIRPRLGQGGFRIVVTEAYERRCAVTGERVLPVLQASHIKPFSFEGPNTVDNGILLRSDLHALFDRGYLTITEDHHVEVSRQIEQEFHNGKAYRRLHGAELSVLPQREVERPSAEFIRWHNEHCYRG